MDIQNQNQPASTPQTGQRRVAPHSYNLPALKIEFLRGPWTNATEFRRVKGMSEKSDYLNKKMKGWSEEKKVVLTKGVEQAANMIIEHKVDDEMKVRERQARMARWMQLKGAEALKVTEPEDADQARKLIVSGMQEERTALGLGNPRGGATNLTQVNVNLPKTKFDAILDGADYTELVGLIAEIRRERAKRAGTDTSGQGQTEVQ